MLLVVSEALERAGRKLVREFDFPAQIRCKDKLITGADIYHIVKATEELTGIEFKSHDLQLTLIT